MKVTAFVLLVLACAVAAQTATQTDQTCANFIAHTAGLPKELISKFNFKDPIKIVQSLNELKSKFGAEVKSCLAAKKESVKGLFNHLKGVSVKCGMDILDLICRAGLCAEHIVLKKYPAAVLDAAQIVNDIRLLINDC